jgi:hypothetical protein
MKKRICTLILVGFTIISCSKKDNKDKTNEPQNSKGNEHKNDKSNQINSKIKKHVTICLAGAFKRTDGANPYLDKFCGKLPGLIKDCMIKPCSNLFTFSNVFGTEKILIEHLDTNKDGKVDYKDDEFIINLVGYSWGGVNAATLAALFIKNSKVAPSRKKIDHLITIDPFSPMKKAVIIPNGVIKHWSYRHSNSPGDDCSSKAPMGPYKGLPSICKSASTVCKQYDYSLKSTIKYYSNFSSSQIGHCTIVRACAASIMYNIRNSKDDVNVPPTVK